MIRNDGGLFLWNLGFCRKVWKSVWFPLVKKSQASFSYCVTVTYSNSVLYLSDFHNGQFEIYFIELSSHNHDSGWCKKKIKMAIIAYTVI